MDDSKRWSIYIDIEGFSEIYQRDKGAAIRALSSLMEALYKIGKKVYPREPERLFIHQFGDGFVVVSSFQEKSPCRPVAICLTLMRHLMNLGVVTKAGVSTGDFADIYGCYPKSVRDAADKDRSRIKLGEGIMTIIPVMGSALINSYKLCGQKQGALLLIDAKPVFDEAVDVNVQFSSRDVIDWIHTDLPEARHISTRAGLNYCETNKVAELLQAYIDKHRSHLTQSWISSTLSANRLSNT